MSIFDDLGIPKPPNTTPGDPDAIAWARASGETLQAKADEDLDMILDALRLDILEGKHPDGVLYTIMVLDFVKRNQPLTDYSLLSAALLRLARYESEIDRLGGSEGE